MNWINLIENDIDTYPKEGYDVVVSDGKHYDVAWYLMSSSYIWMKTDLISDSGEEFKQFKITKWCPLEDQF